ncbi:MAG: undecaprenyldiphospho-muramoylpentapeptide beta-N-acetylglucosaminyltransferase [Actinobacteria bacterium]|nr:undecaprenyldiphospho-muramoylpentapeptide beta-N-acetylglucosaminyltransferase [Actinomycetota bacterium]
MNIAIAGGGTAGHVTPAIAVALALTGDRVSFLGTSAGVEARLVPDAGFSLTFIDVRGFDRARPWSIAPVGWRAVGAIGEARGQLKKLSPDVCLGMGGYVSLPVCLAARSLRVPIVVHEQNIVLGLANRILKRTAARVAVTYEETLEGLGGRGALVGNPIRPEIASLDVASERELGWKRFELDPTRKTILVFGGSLGAQTVNEAALGLGIRWRDRSDVQILHIVGPSSYDSYEQRVREEVRGSRLIYRTESYVERMAEAYAAADFALCRGGATTIAELGAVGLPALIVPYPHHRDRQQERQARILEGAGAAFVVADGGARPDVIAGKIEPLIDDEEALARMRAAMAVFGRPDAAQLLAAVVRACAR